MTKTALSRQVQTKWPTMRAWRMMARRKKPLFSTLLFPSSPVRPLFRLALAQEQGFVFEFKCVWNHMNYKQSRTGQREYDYKTGRQKFLLPIYH